MTDTKPSGLDTQPYKTMCVTVNHVILFAWRFGPFVGILMVVVFLAGKSGLATGWASRMCVSQWMPRTQPSGSDGQGVSRHTALPPCSRAEAILRLTSPRHKSYTSKRTDMKTYPLAAWLVLGMVDSVVISLFTYLQNWILINEYIYKMDASILYGLQGEPNSDLP